MWYILSPKLFQNSQAWLRQWVDIVMLYFLISQEVTLFPWLEWFAILIPNSRANAVRWYSWKILGISRIAIFENLRFFFDSMVSLCRKRQTSAMVFVTSSVVHTRMEHGIVWIINLPIPIVLSIFFRLIDHRLNRSFWSHFFRFLEFSILFDQSGNDRKSDLFFYESFLLTTQK